MGAHYPAQRRRASTLAEDVKVYMKTYMDKVHASTRGNRERYLNAWVERLGSRTRQSVTTQDVIAALNHFRQKGIVKGTPLKPETVNQVRLALLRLYECLNAEHEINPVKRVPLDPVAKPDARGVTYDVVDAILSKLSPGTATAARCRLMAYTGMRPVEIMRIRPDEDWKRAEGTLLIRTAKGGIATRQKLLPQATRALEEMARLQAWGTYWAGPVSRAFTDARKAAGYGSLHLVPYDLRHCYGTLIYEQTGDLKAVKESLRHSTLRLSERYMAAAVSPMLEKVHGKLDTYFADRDKARAKAQRAEFRVLKRAGKEFVKLVRWLSLHGACARDKPAVKGREGRAQTPQKFDVGTSGDQRPPKHSVHVGADVEC